MMNYKEMQEMMKARREENKKEKALEEKRKLFEKNIEEHFDEVFCVQSFNIDGERVEDASAHFTPSLIKSFLKYYLEMDKDDNFSLAAFDENNEELEIMPSNWWEGKLMFVSRHGFRIVIETQKYRVTIIPALKSGWAPASLIDIEWYNI